MAQKNTLLGTYSFNPYSAGSKMYANMSGAPTRGPVDMAGYADRDRRIAARKKALAKMRKGA
jgi:hypothetical protein